MLKFRKVWIFRLSIIRPKKTACKAVVSLQTQNLEMRVK